MGGRLFLLTCLVNLLKPVPNCSGTLMLSVYAKTQTSLQSSVPTTSTTPGQVIEATSKNYFRHNTGSTRKSRSGVSYRFSASPNFRLPLLGSPELPALQPLLRLPSCSPSYQPFSSAPSLPPIAKMEPAPSSPTEGGRCDRVLPTWWCGFVFAVKGVSDGRGRPTASQVGHVACVKQCNVAIEAIRKKVRLQRGRGIT